MERLAFSLPEETKTWVRDLADEHNISRAEALRRILGCLRVSDSRSVSRLVESESPTPLRESVIESRTAGTESHSAESDSLSESDRPESDSLSGESESPRESHTPHSDSIGESPVDQIRENTERIAELEAAVETHGDRLDRLEGEGGAISPPALDVGAGAPADVEPGAAVREALKASGWSKGRNREERQRNAAVAAWALEVLRAADEELRKADVPLDALDDDRTTDTLWLEIIRPAILAVAEAGYVETDDAQQRYRWVGE